MLELASWKACWRALGVADADEHLFYELLACYDQPHRAYHTRQHLAECLAHQHAIEAEAERPAEVLLALWFHDAVYELRRSDNEARSASWAVAALRTAGVDQTVAERVHRLIMATRHDAVPEGRDAQVVVDVDLSILGADPARFDEYERQVRQEYRWVPGPLFRRKRRELLRGFLDRPRLYTTDWFHARYEARARANLRRALAGLGIAVAESST